MFIWIDHSIYGTKFIQDITVGRFYIMSWSDSVFSSRYPVILSIENHCSIKQQKEMARILKEVLGGKIIQGNVFFF
jgi:phosphatidylinositol phospholipase C gamma-1